VRNTDRDLDRITSLEGETIMSTTMSDNSTEDEFNPTPWDDFVYRLGDRTHSLGEYVMKLGDRIHGDPPMGLDEYGDWSYAWGIREGMKAASK
jgi:hypothetical protein